uniref:Nin one binding (NOB1) Zn-ribbon-like domain-containing protein n=1 Tax=Rhodosorus marinus TaxID=101924 RepID=A0A7S3ABH0_9RHOD|mmetsp:Transcript_7991/g.35431  ORF Transcript_7991/g.35431 Transcript_7991/m.35431 type:complete len:283 (+) Transcript_7991:1231-2079(+)
MDYAPEDDPSSVDDIGSEEEEFFEDASSDYDGVVGDEEAEDDDDGVVLEEMRSDVAITVQEAERVEEEEEEEEDDDDDDDDDDGSGWINPDNLKTELEKDLGMTESEEKTHLVGCVTTDYSMQNVLLQMGLQLLSVDGQKVVKHVRRYILRCSCCRTLTRELHRQFCPDCGNHTLVRLPFSIDKKGVARVYYDPNRHPSLKGIKYPIPKPKGGRNNTDLILTEDQLRERRRQLPRRKKKVVDVFDPNTKYNPGMADVLSVLRDDVFPRHPKVPISVRRGETA